MPNPGEYNPAYYTQPHTADEPAEDSVTKNWYQSLTPEEQKRAYWNGVNDNNWNELGYNLYDMPINSGVNPNSPSEKQSDIMTAFGGPSGADFAQHQGLLTYNPFIYTDPSGKKVAWKPTDYSATAAGLQSGIDQGLAIGKHANPYDLMGTFQTRPDQLKFMDLLQQQAAGGQTMAGLQSGGGFASNNEQTARAGAIGNDQQALWASQHAGQDLATNTGMADQQERARTTGQYGEFQGGLRGRDLEAQQANNQTSLKQQQLDQDVHNYFRDKQTDLDLTKGHWNLENYRTLATLRTREEQRQRDLKAKLQEIQDKETTGTWNMLATAGEYAWKMVGTIFGGGGG